jgi:hypothetical protein
MLSKKGRREEQLGYSWGTLFSQMLMLKATMVNELSKLRQL